MRLGGVLVLIYVAIGAVVAATQGYFQGLGNISNLLEAIVAVFAWPLVLAGVDINFAGGAPPNGGGGGGGGGGS